MWLMQLTPLIMYIMWWILGLPRYGGTFSTSSTKFGIADRGKGPRAIQIPTAWSIAMGRSSKASGAWFNGHIVLIFDTIDTYILAEKQELEIRVLCLGVTSPKPSSF